MNQEGDHRLNYLETTVCEESSNGTGSRLGDRGTRRVVLAFATVGWFIVFCLLSRTPNFCLRGVMQILA